MFAKTVKNTQKIEERRRLGYTRIEYQAFQKAYKELKESSDKLIDGNSLLRMRTMYLKDYLGTNYEGLNEAEISELLKRKTL